MTHAQHFENANTMYNLKHPVLLLEGSMSAQLIAALTNMHNATMAAIKQVGNDYNALIEINKVWQSKKSEILNF